MEQIKFQITNIKYQTNNTDRNSKTQTMSRPGRFWSRAAQALAPRVEYWDLRFICNLLARRLFCGVLGICDFGHKVLRQSRISSI
jgi:hypothetical protein